MPGDYGETTSEGPKKQKPQPSSAKDEAQSKRRNLLKGVVKQMIRK